MIIRLRSRDGLERIEVDNNGNIRALKHAIQTKLSIPIEDILLSKDSNLLTTKEDPRAAFRDLADDSASLTSKGISHGEMVFMLYSFERQVEPAYKKSAFETRAFGSHITVYDVMAKQTRIERQDKAKIESVSIDRHTADLFQGYIQGALSFNIKRGGIMYGTLEEGGTRVRVDFIYEPPQEANALSLKLQRNTEEEKQVDFLAGLLGYSKVGWIFAQSKAERDWIMHTGELLQTAAMQDEVGESCATVVVSLDSDGVGNVHFEAFQCSEQCVRLAKEGWIVPPKDGDKMSGVSKMCNPKEPDVKEAVIVASKDQSEVDNDYFLCPAAIASHDGQLQTVFPVENRLLPQGKAELRELLVKGKAVAGSTFTDRMTDLHLLLWLSKQSTLDSNDLILLCEAVREKKAIREGYRMMIEGIAGL